MNITLPHKWAPREYQQEAWDALQTYKRSFLVWHRRAGKDAMVLHHNACSAFERVGNYWYMMPEYSQCRKALWDAVDPHTGRKRLDDAFPKEIRAKTLEQEMKIIFTNGSSFQLMGSDNYDSLVGSTPVGVTYSEYPLSKPESWGYIRPMLLENNGWAAFNGTPRGKNHALSMLKMAQDSKEWFSQVLTANDTDVFTPFQLQIELDELIAEHDEAYGRALWLQEYFCSFDAAIPGSIWGESLTKLENQGRLGYFPHVDGHPVHTAWDLGRDDDTAIWFYQVVGDDLNIIDYYADNFKEPDDYAKILRKKGQIAGWRYGTHWLPHDAKPSRMGMGGKTIIQQFIDAQEQILDEDKYDIGGFAITPSFTKQDGIQAGRKTLKIANFHQSTTEKGYDHLKSYHRKYDKEKKTFSIEPDHDSASHSADAWRYLSLTWKKSKQEQIVLSPHQKLINGNVVGMTFGQMTKEHFKNKRRQRNRLF